MACVSIAPRAGMMRQLEHYRARFGRFGKMVHALPDSYRRIVEGERARDRRPHLARGARTRPLARAPVPVLPRAAGADLRRPGAATHQLQCLGVSDRAGCQPARRVARVAGLPSSGASRTTSWCCPRTTSRSAACTHASMRSSPDTRSASRACTPRWRSRSAPSTSSACCFAAPSARIMLGMATGESIAHMNCLIARGRAVSHSDAAGVVWYRQADPARGTHVA